MIELSVEQDGESIPYMSNFKMVDGEAVPVHLVEATPPNPESLPLKELAKFKTMSAIASSKLGYYQQALRQLAASHCIDRLIEAVDGERTQA